MATLFIYCPDLSITDTDIFKPKSCKKLLI